jgi:predicted small secreted protein
MTLYNIDNKILEIIERGFVVDEDTGEIIDAHEEVNARLEELEFDRTAKIENIALYVKNLEALTLSLKNEENALAERRKAKEKRIESLKNYLTNSMVAAGENGIETSKVCISFRKSEAVVADMNKLDEAYIAVKTTIDRKPDKAAIKKAIKEGIAVEGAYIETKQNLQLK